MDETSCSVLDTAGSILTVGFPIAVNSAACLQSICAILNEVKEKIVEMIPKPNQLFPVSGPAMNFCENLFTPL